MQIAKLFGSIGFQVDTTGLKEFQREMNKARNEIRAFSSNMSVAEQSVKSLTREVIALKKQLNFKVSTTGVRAGFASVSQAVKDTATSFTRFNTRGALAESRLSTLDTKLSSSTLKWQAYRAEVEATANALGMIRGRVSSPNTQSIASNIHQTVTGSGSNPNTPSGSFRDGAKAPLFFGGLAGGNLFNVARQAIVGGIATAIPFALGAMTKNVIKSGRELRSADQVLLAHSEDSSDYKNNRGFIGNLSDETGTDLTESIRGFGRVLSATRAGGGTTDQAQRVFEAFAKYGTTMHLGTDENKRMIKAVEQIFTNQRILGQEINQFANVGIPMKAILKDISNGKLGANSKEVVPEEIKKLAGSKAPNTVQLADWIAKYLVNTAMNNGAYQKAIHSSQAEQGRMGNQWQKFSSDIMENGGDEALASFFRLITSLIDSLKELTGGIRYISQAIDSVTGVEGSSSLLWWALALFLPIGRLGKGISIVGRALAYVARIARPVITAFSVARGATGLLSVAVVGLEAVLFSLFGIISLVVGGLILLAKVGKDVNDSNNGILNWVDTLQVKFFSARVMATLLARDLQRLLHIYGRTVDEGSGWGNFARQEKAQSFLEDRGLIGNIFSYAIGKSATGDKPDNLNVDRVAKSTGQDSNGIRVVTSPVTLNIDGKKFWDFNLQNKMGADGNVQTSIHAF